MGNFCNFLPIPRSFFLKPLTRNHSMFHISWFTKYFLIETIFFVTNQSVTTTLPLGTFILTMTLIFISYCVYSITLILFELQLFSQKIEYSIICQVLWIHNDISNISMHKSFYIYRHRLYIY